MSSAIRSDGGHAVADGAVRRLARGTSNAALAVMPALVLGYVFAVTAFGAWPVTDFENAYYSAAQAIARGESPYPELSDPAIAAGTAYVYVPLTAIIVMPLTAMPAEVAGALVMLLLAVGVVATLMVLEVRDWRCYAVALCWAPVVSALQTGNVTIALGLLAALVWRFRDRPGAAGASLGVSLALKALLWPLLLWLAVARRWTTVWLSVLVAAGLVVASWAVIGFSGFGEHPELVKTLTSALAPKSYTVYALALDLGFPAPLSRALSIGSAALLLLGVVVLSRRGDERRAFGLAVCAALVCTPLVWLHYFALLLVVVGVAQPTLSVAWFVPLAMYASTGTGNGTTLQTALALGTTAATAWLALRRPRETVPAVMSPAAVSP